MAESSISEEKLKSLLKAAVEESLEDMAMVRAIEKGSASPIADPNEVYKILRN